MTGEQILLTVLAVEVLVLISLFLWIFWDDIFGNDNSRGGMP